MAILKPDKTTTLSNGLVAKEYLLTAHNPNKISLPAKRTAAQPLIGVTLHNTDWLNVAAETTPAEQYTRATYNGNMGDARVHWYVDDKCAWRNFDDAYISWHSATGGQGPGNCNTISIESIMRNQTDAVSLASMENTAKLIAWIFGQYGWTVEKNLYTHNYWTNYKATGQCSADLDAQSLKKVSTATKCFNSSELANKSGKYCPVFLLPQWEKFKALIKKYMGASTTPAPAPAPAQPTPTTPASNEGVIWAFLTGKGLNACAVAGLMGNLFAESGLIPTNLQNTYEKSLGMTDAVYTAAVDKGTYTNFVKDSAGYGLAQWTYYTRKQALLDFAKAAGASIGDLTMQLNFLWKELQGYTGVMSVLKTASSVRQASDVVLLQFERPADQSVAVQVKRCEYGQGYYNKYAGKTPTTPTVPPTTPAPASQFKVGDIVQFTGGAVYTSSNAPTPKHSRGKSRCKVTQTYNGKHPYHLISEDGGDVYGWVEAIDITTVGATAAQVKAGSKVKIKAGAKYYAGGAIPAWVASDTWLVTQVTGDRAVLGKNVSGKNNINSPIKVSDLVLA